MPRDMSVLRAELLAATLNATTGHVVKTSFGDYFEKALKLKKMNGSDKTDINNTQSIVSHIMKKLGHHEDARNLMKNALSG